MWTALSVLSGRQQGSVPLPAGLPGLPAQLQTRVHPEQRLPQPQGLCQVRACKIREWIMGWICCNLGFKKSDWKYYIFSGKCSDPCSDFQLTCGNSAVCQVTNHNPTCQSLITTTTTRSTTTTCRTHCDERKICDTRKICDKKRHCDKRCVYDKKCFLIFCKQDKECRWIYDRNCRDIEYNCRNEEYNCRDEDHNCRPICGTE